MRSRLNLDNHHRCVGLFVITWLIASTTTGCATPRSTKNSDRMPFSFRDHQSQPTDPVTLENEQPHHVVAKPAYQVYGAGNQVQTTQNIPTQNRNAFVNPSLIDPNVAQRLGNRGNRGNAGQGNAQQATYQYPATNPPTAGYQFQNPSPTIGFQPQTLGVPSAGFQNGTIQNGPSFLPGNQAAPQQPPAQLQFQPQQYQPPQYQPQQYQPQIQQQPSYFQTPQSFPNQPYQSAVIPPNQIPNNQLPTLPLDIYVPNAPTTQYRIGGTYGSENGLVGQIIIEERDFNIWAWPGRSPYPFRGAGQTLRLEAVPGADLQRYLVSFADPNFRNSDYSFSVSGYLFERQYFDWDEKRVGGRIGVGRVLSDYLSVDTGLRMESVTIDNPRLGTSPQLNQTLGNNNLFLGSIGLTYDTRFDRRTNSRSPYMTPEGSYLNLKFTQAFGDFDFSRGEIDYRRHNLIYERPDGSGRHTLGFRTKLGFSGSSTPVFENYFAGGLSSMRGFDFRGISPIENGVRVGGEFQWLNSLEYMFPLDQNDSINGVLFVDFGTVEESVELNSENFRVAPGLGLRVNLPFAGMGGAPLAFDFAFPVSTATGDDEKSFHFMIGYSR